MRRLTLHTGGESHGPGVIAIIEGLPHGLPVSREAIERDLTRRRAGAGRGARMSIEHDTVEAVSGLRAGRTLGTPLTLLVRNRDFDAAWRNAMDPFAASAAGTRPLTRPRPGHADLAGALKLGLRDARDVLERTSARSTVARVAAGAVAKALLGECGVELLTHVVGLGDVEATTWESCLEAERRAGAGDRFAALQHSAQHLRQSAEVSPVRCADQQAESRMLLAIERAGHAGDTLGGVVEVVALGLPPGLGGYAEPADRLDGRIAAALMSIPAIKGVEIGLGFAAARRPGTQVHDPILRDEAGLFRPSNRAGGIEGGLANGEPVVVRAAMKPIPTLLQPLPSIDLATGEAVAAQHERSDVCAVPAAAVVAEAALAFVLAEALLEKTGGDTLEEVRARLHVYEVQLGRR